MDNDFKRRASIELNYEGVDISQDITPYLLSFSYTDNGTGKADDLQITLQDRDNKWNNAWMPNNGDTIKAGLLLKYWIDTTDIKMNCGTFQVDTVAYNGPPDTIQISAVSWPVASGLKNEQKSKAWEKVTLSQIAARIAAGAGLKSQFETTDVKYDRIDQTLQTDIAFIAQLAEKEGASVKVTNGAIVIYDDKKFESVKPVRTIERGVSRVKSYSFSHSIIDAAYAACTLSYFHTTKKKKVTYTGTFKIPGAKGPTLKIQERVESNAEAIRYARNELRRRYKEAQKASFKLMGDPGLVQGVTVQVKGYGKFDAVYFVETATHSISGGGYETSIECRKVLNF